VPTWLGGFVPTIHGRRLRADCSSCHGSFVSTVVEEVPAAFNRLADDPWLSTYKLNKLLSSAFDCDIFADLMPHRIETMMVKGVSMPPPRMVSKTHKVQKKSNIILFVYPIYIYINDIDTKNYDGEIREVYPFFVWVYLLVISRKINIF
jgi:hypothetical protein